MAERKPKAKPKTKAKRKPAGGRTRGAGPPLAWRKPFLKALEERFAVSWACDVAGISRKQAYSHREKDPEFAEAWDEALKIAKERLEAEAHRRATMRDNPSDTLLIFLLKSHDPNRYRDNYRFEITGPDGGPVKVQTQEARDMRLAELIAKGQGDDSTGGKPD